MKKVAVVILALVVASSLVFVCPARACDQYILEFPEGSTAEPCVYFIDKWELPRCVPPLPNGFPRYLVVEIIQGVFEGTVRVCIRYDDAGLTLEQEENLRLFMSDCVDFNLDGTINGQDLSLIRKGIKNGETRSAANVPFDVNDDGHVDNLDVDIVKEYMSRGLIVNQGRDGQSQARLPWLDITVSVDTLNNFVCGETSHLSIFGIR